jgi:hypothetical protein
MKNHINASVEPRVIIKMDDCEPLICASRNLSEQCANLIRQAGGGGAR